MPTWYNINMILSKLCKFRLLFSASFIAILTFILPLVTSAHVRYLVPEEDVRGLLGSNFDFFFSPFTNPEYILLMIAIILFVLAIALFLIKNKLFAKECKVINKNANGYTPFLPWILRISAGIALIGSGVSGTLISPALSGYEYLAGMQIFLGFLLVTGFMAIPAAVGAIFLYLFAVLQDWYVIGNLDFFAAIIGIFLLENEKPGVDDILGIPDISPFTHLKKLTPLVLRIGVGGAMIFLGIYEKVLNPQLSAYVVENFGLLNVVPVSTAMWVFGAGMIESILGLALLAGYRTRLVCTIAFVVLSMSFFYFNESVYSHITLFGTLSVLFVTRGGRWSFDHRAGRVNKDFK